ncbi:sigma factor-like helix-turn-helix DNA-binding protein [Streptomyces sp. NPDC051742]|uniref:sigma factor-like helix-turn-helix DNA-binding protein n=1 Tax=unclassified Streptomyces TaxID=2593676 RepID=UPI00342AB3E1
MHDDTLLTALTGRFDAHEERLRQVALRMMGSRAEAEEVLATARAALGRTGGAAVRAWLTVAVGQACVRGLQERGPRGPRGTPGGGTQGASAAPGDGGAAGVDSLWLALIVVLDALGAEERLAYVLHDAFGLPPSETARITGGSPEEVTRLARRARARIRGGGAARSEGDAERQRAVAERFLAAARARDARTLAAVLDPDVVAHSERGPLHGAPAVAERAEGFAWFAGLARPALVDGAVGAVAYAAGRPVAAVAFAFRGDRVVGLSFTTGEDRVRALELVFPEADRVDVPPPSLKT